MPLFSPNLVRNAAISEAAPRHALASVLSSLVVLGCLSSSPAPCQNPTAAGPAQTPGSFSSSDLGASSNPAANGAAASGSDQSDLSGAATSGSSVALSASQIQDILVENPELLTELKSQVADQMSRQGIQVNPDDIADQVVYNQVASSSNLRMSITAMLRARGYPIDDALQPSSSAASNDLNGLAPSGISSGSSGASDFGSSALSLPGLMNSGQSNEPPAPTSTPQVQSGQQAPRAMEKANASTDPPAAVHQPTPLDLQSMRDLYTQIPSDSIRLRRFGADVFTNRSPQGARSANAPATPLDVPLGPNYVVGVGDRLTIDLWGGTTQSISRTVDRDGRIFLPEAGEVDIAGLQLEKVQDLIAAALKQQFRNAQVAVTVTGLRTVRVYVVGDVQRPGGYDISALATPLSALYAAGGPTAVGSFRSLHHYRGKQLVEDVDLYDFLLHGVRDAAAHFESGDTLLVPPAGPQVAISGAVRRPAIYELKSGEETLATIIDDAGGLTSAASIRNIRIERIEKNDQRVTVTLPDQDVRSANAENNAFARFEIKDGDRIRIEPILPYSQRAIYLAGHVVRPGRLAYTDGMRLSDVIRSYRDLLPEPATHGEIVRLIPPDLHAETIDFDVSNVLSGNQNLDLRPFDTIRVFGRYQVDPPTVTIRGEVLRPGSYPMSTGMTAAQLVRLAGGFKRDALLESADLTSYQVSGGNQVAENMATLRIGDAVAGREPGADIALKPGDILSIHQIANWTDIGESVMVQGEVKFPGSYGFHDGEHLSSVLRRAGGLLPAAYPSGAVLVRPQVKELEQNSRDELIRQIETSSAAARLSPNLSPNNSGGALQLIKEQQNQVIEDLKSHPPTGRMVIHITANIDEWANTPADIELRRDDVLTIPKQPGFVLVTGQVYNTTALTFSPGKSAGWYLSRAGGTNATANRKEIFIIRANGAVVGRHSEGPFARDLLSTKLNPGDVIVVPQKIVGGSLFWRNLLSTGQLAASAAITAGVAVAAL